MRLSGVIDVNYYTHFVVLLKFIVTSFVDMCHKGVSLNNIGLCKIFVWDMEL